MYTAAAAKGLLEILIRRLNCKLLYNLSVVLRCGSPCVCQDLFGFIFLRLCRRGRRVIVIVSLKIDVPN